MAGVANQGAVMLSTDEPAGCSDGVDVLEGEREAGCEVARGLADDALHLVQLDGMLHQLILS